jgi:uncharacterized protein (UPF0335 family)
MAGQGHNSKSPEITIGNVAGGQLRSFVERVERLNKEKKSIADDIKEVFGEAKAMGYDTKTIRKVINIRKQDQNERMEQEAVLDTYLAVLGMLPNDDFGGDADE